MNITLRPSEWNVSGTHTWNIRIMFLTSLYWNCQIDLFINSICFQLFIIVMAFGEIQRELHILIQTFK